MQSELEQLIERHKAVYADFIRIINELEEAEEELARLEKFSVESLISPNAGECVFWGETAHEAEEAVAKAYGCLSADVWWLKRTAPELGKQVLELLEETQQKNLALVGPAYRSWLVARKKKQAHVADLKLQWEEANEADREAGLAICLCKVSAEEHARRAAYITEAHIVGPKACDGEVTFRFAEAVLLSLFETR